jgi:hypothetical protein
MLRSWSSAPAAIGRYFVASSGYRIDMSRVLLLLLLSGVAAGSGPRRKQRRRSAVLGCSSHGNTRGMWWEVVGRQGSPRVMRPRNIVDLYKAAVGK